MTEPLARTASGTSRLMIDAPGMVPGWQERVFVPSPPAGSDWSYVVDGRYFERLISATWQLVTDAVVATRFPRFALYDHNSVQVLQVPASAGVVASTTSNPFLMRGAPQLSSVASGASIGFIPDILIPPGWSWRTLTIAIDPGDQLSGIVLLVQRFPSDTVRYVTGN